MKGGKKPIRKHIGSELSQRTMRKILDLRGSQQKCSSKVQFLEGRIAKARTVAENQTRTALSGSYTVEQMQSRTLEDIAGWQRQIEAFKAEFNRLEEEINSLENPLGPAVTQRRKAQSTMARLVKARLDIDRHADATLQALRMVLQLRANMTARILETVPVLEFSPGADFDVTRFAQLLSSLPSEIAESSRKWVDWFLGREKGEKPYMVGTTALVLPETLAHHMVYPPGSRAMLTEKQAVLLPQEDAEKAPLGPVEMELQAGNQSFSSAEPAIAPAPEVTDDFPVSGLPMR